MTRRGILVAYRLVAPLTAMLLFLGVLDYLGLIDLSERGLPELVYTLFVVLTFAAGFGALLLLVLCPIIVVRFRRDLPAMLPALLLFLSLTLLVAPLLAGADDSVYQWPGGALFLAFIVAATWAGYFAPRPRP